MRITPKGKITFQLRYRYQGKPRRLDLGSYPLMSLKEARGEAQRLRAQHEQGHDPQIVRLLEKQAILKADSVETLFRQWYEAYCQKNKNGHHDILRSFEIHVFPVIGKLPAEKVSLHEWLSLLEKHAALRPGIAERILINAKQMLKWALRRHWIPASPLAGINAKEDLQIKKMPGSRTLSAEEITRVWRAIDHSRMAAKNKLFLKLCLMYGCRNGELRLAEKSHFDFETHSAGAPTLDRRIADLRHELSLLEGEQRAQERQHRADVLRAMKDLLARHGFKLAELGTVRSGKGTGGRAHVAPLYRDPATGATWSGRGTEPAWIKGRDREAFKVTG